MAPVRMRGTAGRLGQAGVVVTTTSPGSIRLCMTSISAFMAEAETITLCGVSRVPYSRFM